MIVVHHLNNSRSQRILWLLEELGMEYEIKFYARDAKTMLAPPELKALHPLGKSPLLTDGDLVIAESGAIIEYLLETYGSGRLQPEPRTEAARRFKYWLHYAEGSAMSPLLLWLVFTRLPKGPVPAFLRPILRFVSAAVLKSFVNPQLKLHFDYMEAELSQKTWFCGEEFTAADIQMSFPIEAGGTRTAFNENHPHLRAYLRRIHERPAYQRALARGGPYDYA